MGGRSTNISIYDLEGNFITSVFSVNAAAELTGEEQSNISKHLKGETNRVGSYQFVRDGQLNQIGNVVDSNKEVNNRAVAKYYGPTLISTYNSISSAARKNKMDSGTVSGSAESGRKAGIFNFKYIE